MLARQSGSIGCQGRLAPRFRGAGRRSAVRARVARPSHGPQSEEEPPPQPAAGAEPSAAPPAADPAPAAAAAPAPAPVSELGGVSERLAARIKALRAASSKHKEAIRSIRSGASPGSWDESPTTSLDEAAAPPVASTSGALAPPSREARALSGSQAPASPLQDSRSREAAARQAGVASTSGRCVWAASGRAGGRGLPCGSPGLRQTRAPAPLPTRQCARAARPRRASNRHALRVAASMDGCRGAPGLRRSLPVVAVAAGQSKISGRAAARMKCRSRSRSWTPRQPRRSSCWPCCGPSQVRGGRRACRCSACHWRAASLAWARREHAGWLAGHQGPLTGARGRCKA